MDVVTLGAALSIMKKMPDTAASSAAAAENAADRAEEAARTLTIDATLTQAGQAADSKAVGDEVNTIKSGTSILVEHGYFPDAYKTVDTHFGTYTYKYNADDNTFNMNRDETTGTKSISIGISDSGLTLDQRIVALADYPACKIKIDTNIPQEANPRLRIFTYQSDRTTLNHNWYMPVPASGEIVLDVAEELASRGWGPRDVYYGIERFTSDSYTYTEAPYVHIKNYGFFSSEQAHNYNLKEKIANLMDDVGDLLDRADALSDEIESANNLAYQIGEMSAVDSPLTIRRKAGYLTDAGTYYDVSGAVSSVTEKIKCSEGDTFYYYGRCVDSVVTAMWFRQDGSILSTEKIDGGGYAKHIFTAPANASSVVFTSFGSASTFQDYSPGLFVTRSKMYVSPLSQKTWYPCGDSFTAGEFAGISDSVFTTGKYAGKSKTYPYHIGNRTNVDIYRGSTSGETMAAYSGGSVVFSNPSYQFGYKSVPDDADYITLWFGINDSGWNIPVGTIDDSDNTTFYGAWNVVLSDLITRCTKAHIGIIVSNNLSATYVDATIAIAKKWGIPYLDLNYDNSVPLMHYSLRPDASSAVKAIRNSQFAISSENHHPNLAAHEYESYFIEKWLLSL